MVIDGIALCIFNDLGRIVTIVAGLRWSRWNHNDGSKITFHLQVYLGRFEHAGKFLNS